MQGGIRGINSNGIGEEYQCHIVIFKHVFLFGVAATNVDLIKLLLLYDFD